LVLDGPPVGCLHAGYDAEVAQADRGRFAGFRAGLSIRLAMTASTGGRPDRLG